MEHFIRTIGNIDFQDVTHRHGEQFRQACLDQGNAKNTVGKKIRQLKAMFELAVHRKQLLVENHANSYDEILFVPCGER
jgi:hypothetical protein